MVNNVKFIVISMLMVNPIFRLMSITLPDFCLCSVSVLKIPDTFGYFSVYRSSSNTQPHDRACK